jgi:hypothetical protein
VAVPFNERHERLEGFRGERDTPIAVDEDLLDRIEPEVAESVDTPA